MKKLLSVSLFLALLLSLFAFSGCAALATMYETDGMLFRYREDIDGYVLLQYDGIGGEVTVPAQIKGKPVLVIGATAFRGSTVKSVVLPDSLVMIYRGAFEGCTALEEITLPFIGKSMDTFEGIEARLGHIFGAKTVHAKLVPSSLRSVTVTRQTYFRTGVFSKCESLQRVVLPSETTFLGESLFHNCTSLRDFEFPTELTMICGDTFAGTALESVTIPEGVLTVGGYSFSNMPYLESVTVSEGVTAIGIGAFSKCTALRRAVLPNSIQSIDADAFVGDGLLHDVFYKGSPDEWERVAVHPSSRELIEFALRYYSETEPTDDSVLWWHYVDGVPTLW